MTNGGERDWRQRRPRAVSTGLFSIVEFYGLTQRDRDLLEEGVERLLKRYGQAWLAREKDRLRDEAWFFLDIGERRDA